jgi:hypothetical protein
MTGDFFRTLLMLRPKPKLHMVVMAGLDQACSGHYSVRQRRGWREPKTWMAGPSPAMTMNCIIRLILNIGAGLDASAVGETIAADDLGSASYIRG